MAQSTAHCKHSGCYCKGYVIATSKWSKGKCKSCDHVQKEHVEMVADVTYESKELLEKHPTASQTSKHNNYGNKSNNNKNKSNNKNINEEKSIQSNNNKNHDIVKKNQSNTNYLKNFNQSDSFLKRRA
eukprot:73236_1